MSCKRAPKRSGFVLTCDDCGDQVGLAVDIAVEGFPLAARRGWTLTARHDRCPACTRKQPAPKAKTAARGAGASTRGRTSTSSKR